MKEATFRPIGVVHTQASADEIRRRVTGVESVVEVYPEFEPALKGLDGFSHIFILGYFNQLRPEQVGPLQVKPRALLRFGLKLDDLPTMGVFSLDSPTRPNPIGLSLVRLVRKRRNRLLVKGLDYYDGTPVLDIKPYQSSYRAEKFKLPAWRKKLHHKDVHE